MTIPAVCPACGAPWRMRSKTLGAAHGQPHQAVCQRGHHWHEAPAEPVGYDRTLLVDVLVHHRPDRNSACRCGAMRLGESFPEHVADVYENTVRAST